MNNADRSYFLHFHKTASHLCEKRITQTVSVWKEHMGLPKDIVNAMAYSLQAGGKRLRPTMAYASASFLNDTNFCSSSKNNKQEDVNATVVAHEKPLHPLKNSLFNLPQLNNTVHHFALAIEMLHTYSLIHDDLPAMDDDTLRRGKPTCHIKFGEDIAILAGDALQNEAFSTMLCSATTNASQNSLMVGNPTEDIKDTLDEKMNVTPTGLLQATKYLCSCAGINGMVAGQGIDIAGTAKTHESIEEMHFLKTGKLISAALVCPLLLFEKYSLVPSMEKYAKAIGLLYQVTDDILDVTKKSSTLGKNSCSDIRNNKVTYVTLFGEKGSREKAEMFLQESNSALQEVKKHLLAMNRTKHNYTYDDHNINRAIDERLKFFYQLGLHITSRSY